MKQTVIFDGHCDTISELLNQKKALNKNNLHIDIERLSQYSSYTQVFAAFISPEYKNAAMDRAVAIIEKFYEEACKNGITVCKSYSDWEKAQTAVKAFLSLEGGEPINSIADIKKLYDMGVRMIAPTWNFRNRLACGAMENNDTGLTDFGKEAVAEMNRLGIVIDMSHLSRKSFFDVAVASNKPLCASHSCSNTIKEHPRNLTDEQFMKIIQSGGVVGINFYPQFAGENISDIIKHIDHFIALGGENNIGLGSDFDGVDNLPRGMCGAQDMEKLVKLIPYSTKIREKIAFGNFLRVIKAHSC